MKMRMKAGGIISVVMQAGNHAGQGAAIGGGMLEEFFDGGIEALAQQAEEFAIVLETEAQHFGNGHDILADGEIGEDFLVDVLGEQQGALLAA